MLLINADETREQQSLHAIQLILTRMTETLKAIQRAASVPQDAYVTTAPVTSTGQTTAQYKSQLRAALLAIAAGLVITLRITKAYDALASRHRRQSTAGAAIQATTEQGAHTSRTRVTTTDQNPQA